MPLNIAAIKWNIASNLPRILFNISDFRKLTAQFLTEITQGQDFDNYRLTLNDEELSSFDKKAAFVKRIVDQLQKISLGSLSALADQAGALQPIFTRVNKDNIDTKRKFFQQNMTALSRYFDKLRKLGITLSEEAELSLRDAVAGSSLREIHYQSVKLDLAAIENNPKLLNAEILEQIRKANAGDNEALKKVRLFFSQTDYPYHYEIYLDKKPAKLEAISPLVTSETPTNINEFQNVERIHIEKYKNREDYLNLCSPELRLKINDPSEELKNQLGELARIAQEQRISELKTNLLAEITRLKKIIESQTIRLNVELQELQETQKKQENLAGLKFLLTSGELSTFLSRFSNAAELHNFCVSYEINDTSEQSLLLYWQQNSWLTTTSDFLGLNADFAARLLKNTTQVENKLAREIRQKNGKISALNKMNISLAKLEKASEGSQLELVRALKLFKEKDKPAWLFGYGKEARASYAAFLQNRDALLKQLECNTVGYKPTPEREAILYEKSAELSRFLTGGVCLFGGNYRKLRKQMHKTLRSTVTPAA